MNNHLRARGVPIPMTLRAKIIPLTMSLRFCLSVRLSTACHRLQPHRVVFPHRPNTDDIYDGAVQEMNLILSRQFSTLQVSSLVFQTRASVWVVTASGQVSIVSSHWHRRRSSAFPHLGNIVTKSNFLDNSNTEIARLPSLVGDPHPVIGG